MLSFIMSIVFVLSLLGSMTLAVKRRRKAGQSGFKSAVTPLSFYAIAIINFIGFGLNSFGIVAWSSTIVLLIVAAYFMRYSVVSKS